MLTTSRIEWPGMVSEYTLATPHGRDDGPTVTYAHQVGVGFSGHQGLVYEADGRVVRHDAEPGVVYVTGEQPITWLKVRDPTEALEIYPDLALLERLVGATVDFVPANAVGDAMVFAVASRLRRAHIGVEPITDVEASTLSHLLAARLVDGYTSAHRLAAERGHLQAAAVDAVHQYVRGHIGQQLTLDALAATVLSSPFHFARAFKATTGTTPHAFVTEVRMTVARDLLVRSGVSVLDAATAIGFTNVGHFRRLFRRHFGVSPSAFRRR